MLEIQKRVLEIKYDGHVYNVKYPSVLNLNEYVKKIKDAEGDHGQVLNAMIDFLDILGLPKEISQEMEKSDLEKIAERLNEEKK